MFSSLFSIVSAKAAALFFGRLLGRSLDGGAVTTANCAGGALYNVCLLLPVISAIGMSEIAVREFDCGTEPIEKKINV